MSAVHETAPARSSPLTAGILLIVAVWLAAGALLFRDAPPNSALARLPWFIFFVLQVPVLVLVHEFGHYGIARALGWRVPVFVWGSLVIRLTTFRIMRSAAPFARPVAGAIVAVPPDGKESRGAWIAICAAGPLASLSAGLASLALSMAAGRQFNAGAAFALFSVLCFLDAAFNLLPVRRGCDGRQILNLLRGCDVRRSALHARLSEQEYNGVRPRDWPLDLMRAMRIDALWSNDPDALIHVYAHYFDSGDFKGAREALDRAEETIPVLAERALFAAYVDGDAESARRHLAKAPPHLLHSYRRYWQAAAAVAVVEKDRTSAVEAIRKARLLNAEAPSATDFDRDTIDELERRLT